MPSDQLRLATLQALEEALDSFDPAERSAALRELGRRVTDGEIQVPAVKNEVNLHYHTFFSFNAYGWSPSRIAWEARKYGLLAAGIVDFDVLDGMDEFLAAGELIGLRSTAAMETRVFITEYLDHVINSPNEPGISYFMAGGCWQTPPPGTRAAQILKQMRELARKRNLDVLERVNRYLDTVQIDYDLDVLPLTPSGNATERHMLAAYDSKARETYPDPVDLAVFWANALNTSEADAEALLSDTPALHERIRSRLMKHGGVGYVPPSSDTFPTVETAIEMIRGMQALPTATWLDGTNSGEADMPPMLDLLASKGVVAMNIVPDRNWNIKNPEDKLVKVAKLGEAIEAARNIGFPLCVGTEMNKLGLPFVDNFSAPELQPYIEDFIDGAHFFWGHTFLARNAGIGYASDWANAYFGADRRAKNAFYTEAGRLADPIRSRESMAGRDLKSADPAEVLKALK